MPEKYTPVLGGWISTVYGNVQLCSSHLGEYPMLKYSDNKVEGKMVICEVCHPETAIERPKKFGVLPRHVGGSWRNG